MPEPENTKQPRDPLDGSSPTEIPLPHAPLVRVLAQVRFPTILAIQNSEFIAPFQEAIREHYPILRKEQSHAFKFGPQGVEVGSKETTWRFGDTHSIWRVSLMPEFVAIETRAYKSRSDFLERLLLVLEALSNHVRPALVQRIGIRYIDRVVGDDANNISNLIRSEMLGIVASNLSDQIEHTLSEALFKLAGGDELRVRWGRVPKGGTVDPIAIEPIDEPSWVLDLDAYSASEQPFVAEDVISHTRRLAERVYAMFRWTVTDGFLTRYGGEL